MILNIFQMLFGRKNMKNVFFLPSNISNSIKPSFWLFSVSLENTNIFLITL